MERAPKIVTAYRSGCHGVGGNTALPYFPKLAGLDVTYAEKKMTAFRERSGPPVDEGFWWVLEVAGSKNAAENVTRQERMNMEGVAHAETHEEIKGAVAWYAKQSPTNWHSRGGELVAQGKEIFDNGVAVEVDTAVSVDRHGVAQSRGG